MLWANNDIAFTSCRGTLEKPSLSSSSSGDGAAAAMCGAAAVYAADE